MEKLNMVAQKESLVVEVGDMMMPMSGTETEKCNERLKEKEFSQYRQHLLNMVNSINQEIPLAEENQVLIVYKLNTVQKIRKFMDWIGKNLKNGELKSTEQEIVRTAVKIGKED